MVLSIDYTPTGCAVGLPRLGSEDSEDCAGVDLLDGADEPFDERAPVRVRIANEPTRLREGVDAEESVVGGGARFHGIFCQNHPVQVRAAACRSRSSRLRSKAARYRSYASRKPRSTRDEKISSPRGFVVGGIDGIGTAEEERFPSRVGEEDLARFEDVGPLGEAGRGKRYESGLYRDLRGAWRMLRYILKFRSARFAWGT